jgi:hypothetical protein
MAKKKTKAPKTPTKRKPAAKIRTDFMSAFTAEFISDGKPKKWKWPGPTQQNQSILADFETFSDVLMRAGFLLQAVAPDGSNSLSDRLAQFLIAQNWPIAKPVPNTRPKLERTVHLIEISVIVDRLLEAINQKREAGGGPSIWPPH